MRAWPSVAISDLPAPQDGVAPALSLYDARSNRRRAVDRDQRVGMYVCGITPYDATHIGHAATYVAFDLAVRAWWAAGQQVRYVQNVTDVDDPLLERARETGQDWRALADGEVEVFRADMTALGVVPPDVFMGAVEAIPLIEQLIRRLQAAGAVYDVDGDLYYSVGADPAFGSVSGWSREEMLAVYADRGGDPDRPGKRDPLDCLLWQRQRPGEPAWDSELGTGRPGWHVECAAIALEHLGIGFDVQGGGSDLAFPHHEMSASQGRVAHSGQDFAGAFVYAGMVGYQGQKMSKSEGNLVLVSDLRKDGVDPRALRLALLSQHYRSDWEWGSGVLDDAGKRLQRWVDAVHHGGPDPTRTVQEVHEAMADDLDAPRALAAIDEWATSSASSAAGSAAAVAALADASLGIPLLPPADSSA